MMMVRANRSDLLVVSGDEYGFLRDAAVRGFLRDGECGERVSSRVSARMKGLWRGVMT